MGWEVKAIKDDFLFLAQKRDKGLFERRGGFSLSQHRLPVPEVEEDWRRYYPLNRRISAIFSLRAENMG